MSILFYIFGMIFLSLGISLTLFSDLGAGGWDALVENLSKISSFTVGSWVFIIAVLLLIMASVLSKKFPNIKVLVISWLTGVMIDFWYYVAFKNISVNSFLMRFSFLSLGIIFIALGCAFIFVTNFPKNHTETFVFSIAERFNIKYKWAKVGADSTALILSLLIGIYIKDFSNIGIGTFINTFGMGILIDKVLPSIEDLYNRTETINIKKVNKI